MGDFGKTKDKWVCPNDRALTLRAQLKKGWSVKTDSDNSFAKPEQLNDSEQEMIMTVIKKAENIDKSEQERVGRLVERLENMKKNAMGNGSTQCVLCADEFGLLGASPLLCNDCKKAVCTKCSVDTISAHKEPLWLCKICAETRETWKKSGAWFYKGLPKYILPERKSDQQGKYYTNIAASSVNKPPTEPNMSSPICSYNAWLPGKGRNSSDKEYTDSSDDELKSGLLAKKQTTQQKLLIDSVENNDSSIPVSDASQLVPKLSETHSLPYIMTYTDTGYTVTKDIVEDVPEVVPVPYQRDQKKELFRSPTKNHGEPQSHDDNTLHKLKKEGEESDGRLQRKPHKSHVRRDSVSGAESYCNGRTRVSKQHYGMQHQSRQQLQAEMPQEKSPVHRGFSASENVHSPENVASKKHKKKWRHRFKKREIT